MMFATTTLLAAVLATLSPTNAPSSFGTETEQTFALPSIAERDVWLDFTLDFPVSISNGVEVAFGTDVNGDGVLADAESRFAFAIDGGVTSVRDAEGRSLGSASVTTPRLTLRLKPAKGQTADTWKLESVDATDARAPLLEGQFVEGGQPVATWSSARVRVSGPQEETAFISARRSRHGFVFTVR